MPPDESDHAIRRAGLPDVVEAAGDSASLLWQHSSFRLIRIELGPGRRLPAHATTLRVVVTLTPVSVRRETGEAVDLPACRALLLENVAVGAVVNRARELAEYLVLELPGQPVGSGVPGADNAVEESPDADLLLDTEPISVRLLSGAASRSLVAHKTLMYCIRPCNLSGDDQVPARAIDAGSATVVDPPATLSAALSATAARDAWAAVAFFGDWIESMDHD